MCKPSRKIVSTDALVTMMNQELQGYDVCEDCQFDGPILRLQSLAGDGCNWSDQVIIRCSGRSIDTHCLRAVLKVLDDVRSRYNIE